VKLDVSRGLLAGGGSTWSIRARRLTYRVTEPVLAPMLDLAFTVVLVAVLILRAVVSNL
jgi:hypothetical protein